MPGRKASAGLRDVVRACGFALTTAEFALAGRIPPVLALDAIAAELDSALSGALGLDLHEMARLNARSQQDRFDH